MDINPTVDIIRLMSRRLSDAAKELDKISEKIIETNDLTYASEAMQTISNSILNLRLDLLVTRPLREAMKR
jgi:hypothetical protein